MTHLGRRVVLACAVAIAAGCSTAVPSATSTSVPTLSTWERNMVVYGHQHCGALERIKDGPIDPALAATYYDAILVYYQIAEYTRAAEWNRCVRAAVHVYRDRYVAVHKGVIPGFWNFTTGLRRDWERTADAASKEWAIKVSQAAAYAADRNSYPWARGTDRSRETAYSILSYINAEALGEAPRRQRRAYVELSYGYLDQWFVTQSWRGTRDQFSPFMVALTALALIRDWEETKDPRLVPALSAAADYLWQDAWVGSDRSMRYQLNPDHRSSNGRSPRGAPDLNLLIAPMYGWLWSQTANVKYRDQGDALFAGGVNGAWLKGAKQFNQSYFWSFDYVRWRRPS